MPKESERQRDTRIRLTVFAWLEEQTQIHGDVLPWSLLAQGLHIDGERVPLVSQQGIFKPRVLPELPLSIHPWTGLGRRPKLSRVIRENESSVFHETNAGRRVR